MALHASLGAGRWQTLTLAEQLGNVGSEVHRVVLAQAAGNEGRFERAFARALELLDLTIADPRWSRGRRELTRAREVLCDTFVGDQEYHTSPAALDAYFLQFATAARR